MFESLLRAKSERVAHFAAAELDVALGADDRRLIAAQLEKIVHDPDFASVAVRDASDHIVVTEGNLASGDVFAGEADTAQRDAAASMPGHRSASRA